MESETTIVAIDVETTALSPAHGARIIEIGAVAFSRNGAIAEFSSLVDPGVPISPAAQRVHGISRDMLAGKAGPQDVLPEFRRFVGNCALVAHNAGFDLSFLRHEFGRLGLGFNNSYHCTLAMSRKRFPGLRDHKLATVYRHLFGKRPEGARTHRALDDARMVAEIWKAMIK